MIVIDSTGRIACGTSTNGASHKIAGYISPSCTHVSIHPYMYMCNVSGGLVILPSLGLVAMLIRKWVGQLLREMVM